MYLSGAEECVLAAKSVVHDDNSMGHDMGRRCITPAPMRGVLTKMQAKHDSARSQWGSRGVQPTLLSSRFRLAHWAWLPGSNTCVTRPT